VVELVKSAYGITEDLIKEGFAGRMKTGTRLGRWTVLDILK
jgi:hypothetical protein